MKINPVRDSIGIDLDARSAFSSEVIKDFWICCVSRECSLLGRREVLTGKAKFGILGDGKEVPQVAMARAFKKGDWRSGYYRDQTFMMAIGLCTVEQYFAQLYADPDNDDWSGGRQMNAHFASPTIDDQGNWLDHTTGYNISSDISSTGGQMARALGLALSSKLYRAAGKNDSFSVEGNEVSFCTIGDASTSEGVFWETMNAAVVTKVPIAVSVWDDGYGISVPKALQTSKGSISTALGGMAADELSDGLEIYNGKAWDYPGLVELYERAINRVRKSHVPALIHIEECTQPQGHSTSGSHERYKTKERLEWEKDADCIKKMEEWMIVNGISTSEETAEIKDKAKKFVREGQKKAWINFSIRSSTRFEELKQIVSEFSDLENLKILKEKLSKELDPSIDSLMKSAQRFQFELIRQGADVPDKLLSYIRSGYAKGHEDYHTNLYSESAKSALKVPIIKKNFSDDSSIIPGYQILNQYFDKVLERDPSVYAFGEDVGQIGDVNQGFAGLQVKYGKERVFDSGIREWTIMGQAIGLAMRGMRPIAEIQYLDYLIYGLAALSDDLATIRYRSDGIQQAPVIIRTRGHRLEGIWHAGSPMGMLLGSLRGIYIMVPRDMVQAVGFYNTMLQSDDPGLIIESLNGYRLKEKQPDNLGVYSVPLGVPEVITPGEDVTLVTYGSCVRIAQEAVEILSTHDISVELIDAQTLIPFDLESRILDSLKKTNRIIFMDEDLPGGATAFMLKEVLENQKGYQYLDSAPVTISAKDHRTPFGSAGDYFTKPNIEDVVKAVYNLLNESDPDNYQYRFEV